MEKEYELVGRFMLSENGAFKVIKSWYKGWHSELGGKLINGWSGQETEVEGTVIIPIHTFTVYERSGSEKPNTKGDKTF